MADSGLLHALLGREYDALASNQGRFPAAILDAQSCLRRDEPVKIIEAIYEDGVFHPRGAIDLQDGSHVELELRKAHAPGIGQAKRRWEPRPLSELEGDVLEALEFGRRRNLEDLLRRLDSASNWGRAAGERIELDRADVESALRDLWESGYVAKTADPASVEGYMITAMGLVVATLEGRSRKDRRRMARGRPPSRRPPLPIPEHFVPSFQELNIAYLDLSHRTYNSLMVNGIDDIGSLCRRTRRDLYQFERIGKRSIEEIESALWKIELDLKPEGEGV